MRISLARTPYAVLILGHIVISAFLTYPSCSSAQSQEPQTEKTYVFGVVPQFTPRQIAMIWLPILERLEQETGFQFELQGTTNIPDFETKFQAGSFDIAYMNPYHSLLAFESEGYTPIVRDGAKKLFGILVVRKDSQVAALEDLEGATVAFPAPNALGASLMTRAEFANRNISIIPKYVQTHSSVYLDVVMGRSDAGGGVMRSLNGQPQDIRDQLKVIFETTRVNPHPVVAHSRVPENHARAIQQAFLRIAETETGRALLAKVPMNEVINASLADYTILRDLNLDDLVNN